MSKLNDILDFVVARQAAMNFQVNGNDLTVVKRKLPKREESVDASYMVTVSGAEQIAEAKRAAFGGKYFTPYVVEVTLVTPNDRDQLLNLADHAAWFEATRANYKAPGALSAVGNVYNVDVVQAPMLDRAQIKEGYDYTQVVLRVTTFDTQVSSTRTKGAYMAISLENMVGYIRSRKKPGRTEEVELYIDPRVQLKQTANGPVVTKPADCAGILYGEVDEHGKATGRLKVEYPEE